jgi:GTP-binding protein Era
MTQRCGYVALLGRPNAGKSTLLNALVGDKLAVVSRKPQTTRNRILGIALHEDAQILFLDTPGMHKDRGKNLINTVMNRVAMQAAGEADLVIYLVDIMAGFCPEDEKFLGRILKSSKAPVLVLAAKADAIVKMERASALAGISLRLEAFFATEDMAPHASRLLQPDPVPLSAKRPEEVAELREFMADHLNEGPWLFGADDLTDMPRNFICAELIREQIFRQIGQEIPYGTAVKVDSVQMKPEMVVIHAKILLSQKSHKPIILGKGGSRIKSIGTGARESLEQHFDQKVFLDLNVGVAEGWIDDQRLIAELANISDDVLSASASAASAPN